MDTAEPAWTLEGWEVSEQLGLVVSGVGDLNGDRFADFMISRVHTASTNGAATWEALRVRWQRTGDSCMSTPGSASADAPLPVEKSMATASRTS